MNPLPFAALAAAGAALLLALAFGLWVGRRCRRVPAITHLTLETTMSNATVGVPKPFLIVAKAGDATVDLGKFPSALTDVQWGVSDPMIASVNVLAEDGSAVELTFSEAGEVELTVAGKNVKGDIVSKTVSVVGVVAVPVVDSIEIVEA